MCVFVCVCTCVFLCCFAFVRFFRFLMYGVCCICCEIKYILSTGVIIVEIKIREKLFVNISLKTLLVETFSDVV